MVRSGTVLLAIGIATLAQPVLAANVALNKPVSVVSGAGSLLPPSPAAGVITDGLFLAESTAYSNPAAINGSLRWNTALAGSTTIEIQLGNLYTIDGIIVQADDNDSLLVTYLDANNTFQPLYNVPFLSVGFGFRTRPNADQITYAPLAPITTTTIRVTDSGGDGFYGLSELQLNGVLVPEPASLTMLAVASVLTLRRRRAS